MSLVEIQKLTAKLYTDSDLRRHFFAEPEKIGQAFDLTEKEIAEIAAVLPSELNFFAESLYFKRLREVEKLLPRTKRLLAADFEKRFRDFSSIFLPTTIKKHLEDAICFSEFLMRETEVDYLRDFINYERATLIFNGFEKQFLFQKFNYDVRKPPLHNSPPRKKLTVAVWLQIRGKIKHFVWSP